MQSCLKHTLYYAVFGLLSTAISTLFVPQFFTGSWVIYAVYGVLMAASMFLCNELELKVWQTEFASARADNAAWRLAIRFAIYILVPATLIYAVSFTGVFTLVRGYLTAVALTWMPLMIGAWLNYFPAKPRT